MVCQGMRVFKYNEEVELEETVPFNEKIQLSERERGLREQFRKNYEDNKKWVNLITDFFKLKEMSKIEWDKSIKIQNFVRNYKKIKI